MRRLALPAAIAVLAGAPAMVGLAAPAQAYATPTFSDVDVSTPGHAKLSVTTDAPYVVAWLRSTTLNVRVGDPAFVETAGGAASFDLETWGVDSGQVMARACQTPDLTLCDPIVLSPTFVPTTVDPVITWPSDDTVGAADSYAPTVADPDGGGSLVAVWQGERTLLTPGTLVPLPLTVEGASSVSVLRCSSFAPKACQPTGLTHPLEVNRVLSAWGQTSPPYLNPDTAKLAIQFGAQEGLSRTFTFDWDVANSTGAVVPDVGGVIENLTADGNGLIQTQIDVSALPDGSYSLSGRLSYADPAFGDVGRTLTAGYFILDRAAPALGSTAFSSASLYPYNDGFQDNVTLAVSGAENGATVAVRITDEGGFLVRSLSRTVKSQRARVPWLGDDVSGAAVPAGTYTLTAYAQDTAGNKSLSATWTVAVVRQRLVWTTFRHAYTAAETLTQVHVGSCSSVVKPSSYHWKGSIELQSDSRCHRAGAPAIAESVHSVTLPVGTVVTGLVKLNVYGGSPIDRMSEGTMWVRNGSGPWRAPVALDDYVDWHPFTLDHVVTLLGPAHRLTWRVRVDHEDKYSLGSVKVDVRVATLVAE